MSDPEGRRLELTQVLERFPDSAALIRRLVIADEHFASICEDYGLATATLAALREPPERRQDHAKIAEYALLVTDLEREVAEALRVNRDNGGENADT